MLPAGSTFAGYEIRGVLGVGGYAVVYEAYDARLLRSVALKVSSGSKKDDGAMLREARAIAAIRHVGLPTIHTVGVHDGVPYSVMEHVRGTTLAQLLWKEQSTLRRGAIGEIVELLTRLAEVLSVVHRAGLVHRDVSPSNVMIAPGGRVVLMDFGLVAVDAGINQLSPAGTPPYLAPETISRKVRRHQAHAVDTYSLGVIAFDMLTGRLPFDAVEPAEWQHAHLFIEPPKVSSLRPDAPHALSDLVDSMLAKEPSRRPSDMDAVLGVLRAASGQPLGAVRRVLVVDDDDDIATLVRLAASEIDATIAVSHVSTAQEAMSHLIGTTPDLVLIDLVMPEVNGVELMMSLQGTPLIGRARVAAMSASMKAGDRDLLRRLGVAEFAIKDSEFHGTLRSLLLPLVRPSVETSAPRLPQSAEAALLDVVRDPVAILTAGGDFTHWNGAFEELVGRAPDERVFRELFGVERPLQPGSIWSRLLAGQIIEGERFVARIGRAREATDLLLRARPMWGRAGEVIGAVVALERARSLRADIR